MLQKQRLYMDKCLNVYRRVMKDLEVICNRNKELTDIFVNQGN